MHATFKIADGLIVDHVDRFSFWKWSRQAIGTKGLLLGWTPFLRAQGRRDRPGRARQVHRQGAKRAAPTA